ncbi:hypothetical protein JHK87_012427 [Glycine soja]|nr:hypothetical protein JHK87_012427 [Glycine soja]
MGIVEEAHNMTIVGKGNEIVILTHGFGTDQSVWKHLVPHLVDDYRVVLYDNIGAGTTNPDYFDNIGFQQEDLTQLYDGIRSNYKTWCSGFTPLVIGGDMDSVAVQEFSRTLFYMRPDIALSLA